LADAVRGKRAAAPFVFLQFVITVTSSAAAAALPAWVQRRTANFTTNLSLITA
jgi:hypothetical protein